LTEFVDLSKTFFHQELYYILFRAEIGLQSMEMDDLKYLSILLHMTERLR